MGPALRLYAAVGVGSALGAVARWVVSLLCTGFWAGGVPFGTFAVNLAGSFLIGFYAALSAPGGPLAVGPVLRQGVLAGFCGGFTTFSVFSLEAVTLAADGARGAAGLVVLLSVLSWLVAVAVGDALGRRMSNRKAATG